MAPPRSCSNSALGRRPISLTEGQESDEHRANSVSRKHARKKKLLRVAKRSVPAHVADNLGALVIEREQLHELGQRHR